MERRASRPRRLLRAVAAVLVPPHAAPELDRRLPRVLLGLALALPVLLVAGALVASSVLQGDPAPAPDTDRLVVAPVPTPAAASADCARLMSGLAQELTSNGALLPRRVLADPVPPGTVAWGGGAGPADRPVVFRCGLPRPPELTPTSVLLDVDGVEWLQVPGDGESTWIAVDRAVYVGLTVPDDAGTGALQDVSRGVKITLTSRASPPG